MTNTNKEMLTSQIIAALNEDESFVNDFITAQDAPAVQEVLAEHGFELTLDEINELFSEGVTQIQCFAQQVSDELSEEQLSQVAGGGFIRYLVRGAVSAAVGFGFGCLCGVCPAAAVATPYVVGGLALWCAAGYLKKGW